MPRIFSKTRLKLPASGGVDFGSPSNTVPATQTTPVGTAKQFSDSGGNAIVVSGGNSPMVTATLTTTNGTIEVIPNPATLVWYNNTDRVCVTGSVANVNRALNGMFLRPTAGYNGTATIAVRTTNGCSEDSDSFDVTVGVGTPPAPSPQPPVNTTTSAKTTPYQTVLNLASANISVYDADSASSLTTTLTMTGGIATVSIAGGAQVTGNSTNLVTIAGTMAQVNAALATLTYTPNNGFYGAGQIQMATSDGSLVDIDTIAITVSPPVGAPVNTVPGATRSVAPGATLTYSVANGSTISVSDPNSANLTVTLKANKGVLKAVATGTLPLADGYPPKVIYGFWPFWGSQNLTAVSTNFSIIGLFHFRNSGNGLDNGAAAWPQPGWPSAGDVQTVRGRGQKVFIVVGGVSNQFNYQTQAQSDNLLASLTPFIDSLGGVDGIDFNNWVGDPVGDYATQLKYIAGKLKTQYGSTFAITAPVKTSNSANRTLMKALSDDGKLNWANPQFTDNAAFKTANAVKNYIDTWVATPLSPTKVLMGLSSNYNMTTDSLTLAECTREWDAAFAVNPTLRGVGCYNTELDAAVSNAFANAFKARFDTAMQGTGASITTNDTKQVVIYGTIAQCNAALDGLTYKADVGASGSDTIEVTSSDGTLTDVDNIPVMVTP